MGPAEGQVFPGLLRDIGIGSRAQHESLSEGIGHVELRVASEYVIVLREVVIDLQVALIIVELISYSAAEVGAYSSINLSVGILSRCEQGRSHRIDGESGGCQIVEGYVRGGGRILQRILFARAISRSVESSAPFCTKLTEVPGAFPDR